MPLGVHETGLSIFDPSAPIDVYASGADDDVQINAALTKAGAWRMVRLFGEFHWDDNPVLMSNYGAVLDCRGAYCYYGGTGHAIEMDIPSIGGNTSEQQIIGLRLLAESSALTSATAVGVYIDEAHETPHIDAYITGFRAGVGVQINATTVTTTWSEGIYFPWLSVLNTLKGVELTGAGAINEVRIGYFHWSPYDNTSPNYGILNSSTGTPTDFRIDQVHLLSNTTTNCTGISYGAATNWHIGEFIWDDNASGNVSITGTTDIVVERVSAQGSGHFFRDASIPWVSLERALIATYGGDKVSIPVDSLGAGQWVSTVVGSGANARNGLMYLQLGTGATANSSGLLAAEIDGFSPTSDSSGNWQKLDWRKRLVIKVTVSRFGSDAQGVCRLQLKEINTIGALTEAGIGWSIANLAVSGESYGSSVATVDLSSNLASTGQTDLVAFHDPNVPQIQFFVNGTKKASQSTSAKIPQAAGSALSYLTISTANGAAGGTDVGFFVTQISIWQEE